MFFSIRTISNPSKKCSLLIYSKKITADVTDASRKLGCAGQRIAELMRDDYGGRLRRNKSGNGEVANSKYVRFPLTDRGSRRFGCGWRDVQGDGERTILHAAVSKNQFQCGERSVCHADRPFHQESIIGRVLGRGGFGIPYLSLDPQLNVKVAVKEFMPGESATRVDGIAVSVMTESHSEESTYGAERFQGEARTLA